MQNWEKSKFDESWKDAFEGAEVPPSELVWSGLDQKLTQAEGDSMKKRVVAYQRLAAACILFALMAGLFGAYYWSENAKQQLTENKIHSSNPTKESVEINKAIENQSATANKNELSKNDNSVSTRKSTDEERTIAKRSNKEGGNKFQTSINNSNEKSLVKMPSLQDEEANDSTLSSKNSIHKSDEAYTANLDLPEAGLLPVITLNGEAAYVEIVRKLPALPAVFVTGRKKEKMKHELLWASVSAAAGQYSAINSGLSYAAAPIAASSINQAHVPPTPVGKSFAYGVLGGVRILPRWVLQSGVQYMNQSTPYVTNIPSSSLDAVSFAVTSSSQYSGSVSSPYDITSTNEFVSVPVQMGYLLINRKIGWQINPGVATDFFLRNTLADPSGQRQSYSQSSGADSPYRSVNFAGLMSTEVSYKLGKNYRLSLVPGLKYSFSPALKSQTVGNPLLWDVGFRFRYIIK